MMDGDDLLRTWQERKKAWHFEGESGMEKLEELCGDLGYEDTGFRFGTPIEHFLSDNPGAIEKVLEFIAEELDRPGCEWRENLGSELGVDPDGAEEEEEDEREEP